MQRARCIAIHTREKVARTQSCALQLGSQDEARATCRELNVCFIITCSRFNAHNPVITRHVNRSLNIFDILCWHNLRRAKKFFTCLFTFPGNLVHARPRDAIEIRITSTSQNEPKKLFSKKCEKPISFCRNPGYNRYIPANKETNRPPEKNSKIFHRPIYFPRFTRYNGYTEATSPR